MRTTIELPDRVFRMAKHVAAERGSTLRELVTQAVEHELVRQQAGSVRRRLALPVIRLPDDAPILRLSLDELAAAQSEEERRGLDEVYRRR